MMWPSALSPASIGRFLDRFLVLNDDYTLSPVTSNKSLVELLSSLDGFDSAAETETMRILLDTLKTMPLDRIYHYAKIGQYIRALRVKDKLVDVTIDVEEQTFGAHRIVLACHSKYFADVFLAQPKTINLPYRMRIGGISAYLFHVFVRYVYMGSVEVTPENIRSLMFLAKKFHVPQIMNICGRYVQSRPPENSSSSSLNFTYSNPSIKTSKSSYLLTRNNFHNLTDGDLFLNLPVEILCELLSDDYLKVTSEMDVFWGALKWLTYLRNRRKFLVNVMKNVRFALLRKTELFQCFEVTGLLRESAVCRNMIMDANWIITADEIRRDDPLKLRRPKPRMCLTGDNALEINAREVDSVPHLTSSLKPARESYEHLEERHAVESYHDTSMTMSMSTGSQGDSSIRSTSSSHIDLTTKSILVIGGFRKGTYGNTGMEDVYVKEVSQYSPSENKWEYYKAIPHGPEHHQAVVMLDGKLYFIGGSDFSRHKQHPVAIKKCFVFNPTTETWSHIASMKTRRIFHSVCAAYGMLYAIGGQDNKYQVLKSAEVYNPSINKWKHIPSMPTRRFSFGATVCDGHIYIVGGFGIPIISKATIPVLRTFETYDPRTNAWRTLAHSRMSRCLCSLVNVGHRLYLCAGATRSGPKEEIVSTTTVEIYDVRKDHWHSGIDLKVPRHHSGATTIGSKIYIIGGYSSTEQGALRSVECYDTRRKCWVDVDDIPYEAKGPECVVLTAHPP